MKTNQPTQRKEQQTQQEHPDSNQQLEDGGTLLYSNSVESTEDSLVGIATSLFLIFGFPFYIIIGFTALTAYLSERTWSEFGQEITCPAGILLAVIGISIVLALAFKAASRATLDVQNTKGFHANS